MLVLLLLAAFGWGAVHALSPGHGKAMVAAYLVGTRGTARHAAVLGATVTVTHTAGVFAARVRRARALGVVLPEQLYPWLNLASGLLVVAVGAAVLRARRARGTRNEHGHHHHHHHEHEHVSPRAASSPWARPPGLIPCPSALVVLLAAVAQHQLGLGLVLIVAFSLGLAATLTGLGIAVVHAHARSRCPAGSPPCSRRRAPLVIVGVGVVLTFQAAGQLA